MCICNEFQSQPCPTTHCTYNEMLEGSRCCEMLESVQTHLIMKQKVGVDLATFASAADSKTGCGDNHKEWTPISTLCSHSLYLQWDVGRVKVLSIAWISPNTLDLGVKSGCGSSHIFINSWLTNRLLWPFRIMNSNLNLVWSFIILMIWHWKGQGAVNCLNQSKHTGSWCKSGVRNWNCHHRWWLKNQAVVMSICNEFQSQPCMIIHYMQDMTLEESRCCHLLESVQTHLILV